MSETETEQIELRPDQRLTIEQVVKAPRWTPVPRIREEADLEFGPQRDVWNEDGVQETIPLQQFEPAIDPDGNFVNVPVRTNPLDPKDPKHRKHGADRGPNRDQSIDHRQRYGFLFVDLPEKHPKGLGMQIDDRDKWLAKWRKYCVDTANKRRLRHLARSTEVRDGFKSAVEKMVDATVQGQARLFKQFTTELAKTRVAQPAPR